MEQEGLQVNDVKQRHGCVSAWLIFIIVVNSLSVFIYLLAHTELLEDMLGGLSPTMIMLLVLLSVLNVVYAAMLLNWKKLGFWGIAFNSIVALVLNLSLGLGFVQSFLGLLGILVLYGILQIKQGNVSAWSNLE